MAHTGTVGLTLAAHTTRSRPGRYAGWPDYRVWKGPNA